MQRTSDHMEPAGVIRFQKNPGHDDINPMETGYERGVIKDDTDNTDDEVLIVCSVICDENDTDVAASTVNKLTYNHEVDGEQIMFCSDLEQLAMHMKNDQVNQDCASAPIVRNNIENGKSLLTCEVCNRQFLRRISLKYHLLKHAGQRPYSCSMCDRKYTLKLYLEQHMKIHARDNLPCPFCDGEFASELDLRNHLHVHLVDNMLNTDEVEEEDNSHNGDVDDTTDLDTFNERISDFNKAEHEHGPISRASSVESAAETVFLHNGDTNNSRNDSSFMDNTDQVLEKDIFPSIKPNIKKPPEGSQDEDVGLLKELQVKKEPDGSQSEAVNLLKELQADIDQELFDLQEVDFQETDECVQFLMSKVSSDFKQFIQMQNQDKVNHKDIPLLTQDAEGNIVVDNDDDNIDVEVDEEKFVPAIVKLEPKSEPPNDYGFNLITKNCIKLEPKRYDKKEVFSLLRRKYHKNPLPCEICGKIFMWSTSLNRHRRQHEKGKFQCDHCNMYFNSEKIDYHIKLHFSNFLECTSCFMHFQELDKFIKHRKSHIINTKLQGQNDVDVTDGLYECRICKRVYARLNGLKKHMKVKHSADEKVPCPLCNKRFDKKSMIEHHRRVHSNGLEIPKSYVAILEKTNQKVLQMEDESVDKDKVYPKLDVKELVKRENKKMTGIDSVNKNTRKALKLKCKLCSETWFMKKYLKKHLAAKHFKKKCKRDKDFDYDAYIEVVFVNVKVLRCDHCNKAYTNFKILHDHIKYRHFPEDNIVCRLCNKKFQNQYFLKTHMRTHSAARPYKCESCGKCYSSSTNLNRHTKESHSNDPDLVKKPIQCQMCSCWCANKLTFKSHLQFHHGYTLDQVKDI